MIERPPAGSGLILPGQAVPANPPLGAGMVPGGGGAIGRHAASSQVGAGGVPGIYEWTFDDSMTDSTGRYTIDGGQRVFGPAVNSPPQWNMTGGDGFARTPLIPSGYTYWAVNIRYYRDTLVPGAVTNTAGALRGYRADGTIRHTTPISNILNNANPDPGSYRQHMSGDSAALSLYPADEVAYIQLELPLHPSIHYSHIVIMRGAVARPTFGFPEDTLYQTEHRVTRGQLSSDVAIESGQNVLYYRGNNSYYQCIVTNGADTGFSNWDYADKVHYFFSASDAFIAIYGERTFAKRTQWLDPEKTPVNTPKFDVEFGNPIPINGQLYMWYSREVAFTSTEATRDVFGGFPFGPSRVGSRRNTRPQPFYMLRSLAIPGAGCQTIPTERHYVRDVVDGHDAAIQMVIPVGKGEIWQSAGDWDENIAASHPIYRSNLNYNSTGASPVYFTGVGTEPVEEPIPPELRGSGAWPASAGG